MDRYEYFIEHDSKGVLIDGPWHDKEGKWKWAWSKPRSDAMRLNLAQAKAILALLPVKDAYIMEVFSQAGTSRYPGYRRITHVAS